LIQLGQQMDDVREKRRSLQPELSLIKAFKKLREVDKFYHLRSGNGANLNTKGDWFTRIRLEISGSSDEQHYVPGNIRSGCL
jgi:hypothetical protein